MARLDLSGTFPLNPVHYTDYSDHIIVGAGLSGLVYAFEIIKLGVDPSRIRFLEAEDIEGGRIKTIEHGGRSFDAGASWIHGFKNSALYIFLNENWDDEFVQAFGPKELDDIFIEDRLSTVHLINRAGILVPDSTFLIAGKEVTLRGDGRKELETHFQIKSRNGARDVSFKQLRDDGASPLEEDLLRLLSSTWMAAKLRNISGKEVLAEPAGSGGLQVKGGMARIPKALRSILESKGVKFDFNHPVSVVKHHGNGYSLTCKLPDGSKKSIHAKTLYMTPSVGVWQSGSIKTNFDLSPQIQTAFDSLYMANLRKMFLPLKDGFYANRLDPSSHEKFAPNTRIDNIDVNIGKPVFAHCYSGGQDLAYLVGANKDLARGSAEDLRAVAYQMLNPALPGYDDHLTADPMGINWEENAHTRGSYSGCLPGSDRAGEAMQMHGGAFIIGGTEHVKNEADASTMGGAVVAAQQGAIHTARFIGLLPPEIDPPRRRKSNKIILPATANGLSLVASL